MIIEMDILTGKCSDKFMARVLKQHDQKAVRWYVFILPIVGDGHDRISSPKRLGAELSRHERCRETLSEYFPPSYVEARKVGDKTVNTRQPLLYNYAFIYASEDEIFRLKCTLPLYNFLPRASSGGWSYPLYLSGYEMDTLRWVVASYSSELPVYVSDSGRLLKGDRVRITSNPFTDMEAEVVMQPSDGHKDVMVRVLDCLWAPLFEVRAREYELIELNTGGKYVYTRLDNDRLSEDLRGALDRYHASGMIVDEDARLTHEVLRGYASLCSEADVVRCKSYSLLLPAYLLLSESDELDRSHVMIRSMLPVIEAGQSRVLLLVALYDCADDGLHQRMAHELIGPWMEEVSPKRSRSVLIHCLRDYDHWFGHGNGDE